MDKPKTYTDRFGQCEGPGERGSQRAVAEAFPWRVARECMDRTESVRDMLHQLGFTIVDDDGNKSLFFYVIPPEGWTKITEGYWTFFRNPNGEVVFEQFFKGAVYDTRAQIHRILK
jgi:hypothetical protein